MVMKARISSEEEKAIVGIERQVIDDTGDSHHIKFMQLIVF